MVTSWKASSVPSTGSSGDVPMPNVPGSTTIIVSGAATQMPSRHSWPLSMSHIVAVVHASPSSESVGADVPDSWQAASAEAARTRARAVMVDMAAP